MSVPWSPSMQVGATRALVNWETTVQIAVLGTGQMGHALAERLLESGHDLTVWNRTPHRADDLVARGASEARTPARAAAGADATFTSLADDAAVLAVVTGPDGVAGGLGGGVLCDASTVSPQTTARLRDAVAGRMLASPILGSPAAVVSGDASYLIGGPSEHYDRLRPAYDALAEDERRRYWEMTPRCPPRSSCWLTTC